MNVVEVSAVLGNIGEFVGSLAVLGTLLYLAVQVRHGRDVLEESRRSSQAAYAQSLTQGEIAYASQFLKYADIWDRVLANDPFPDPVDKRRALLLYNMYLAEMEHRYTLFQLGFMDAADWQSREMVIRIGAKLDIYPDWQKTPGSHSRSTEFRDYLHQLRIDP